MANEIAKFAAPKPVKRPATNPVAPTSSASSGAESTTRASSKPNSLVKHSGTPVSADVRRVMIAEAAYYIAERRGFAAGNDVDDWLLAEKQIDATLSAEVVPGKTA